MNVKETKTRVKNWCEEHKNTLCSVGTVTLGFVFGACVGKALGDAIANGYDRTYKMAIQDGYNKGRSDAIAIMLRDTDNSEVVKALAEHTVKYCKER